MSNMAMANPGSGEEESDETCIFCSIAMGQDEEAEIVKRVCQEFSALQMPGNNIRARAAFTAP